ncbi:MAG: ATP-binding protein [Ruminococcus sp.]|nr:ATP-binding protein [Ruminococcus sp.]
MDSAINNIIVQASEKASELHSGNLTYVDGRGLRRCRICGGKLETILSVPHLPKLDGKKVNCICRCDKVQAEKIRAELKEIEIESTKVYIRAACFKSAEMRKNTFDNDDSSKSKMSELCRRWVNNYAMHLQKGDPIKWLFIHGDFGTGKTFYAACIANAMIDMGYRVRMVTGADIEAEIFGAEDKAELYAKFVGYDILILDDFATERKSDYMYEILYNVINDRYNARKAMIITSNMTTAETVDPKDERVRRIMSRLWEVSYPIELIGEDRRKAKGAWK